ncbi:MAG: hypothetical protein IPM16_19610 [Chloroflexi bacterium]|nr:hypothetical protein [Chloroflexota bacterium]
MNLTDFRAYTAALTASLAADPRVIGLIAAGSMAEQGRTPDAWSDHDFLVVVEDGAQESFRTDLRWMPMHERIAFSIRETEHGLKVLYDIPHLAEFAIFDRAELDVMVANDYRVLIDRGGIAEAMTRIAAKTAATTATPDYDPQRDLLMVLSLIYVGYGRWARGEHLSAHVFLKHHLMHHLLRLLRHLHAGDAARLDSLDPFRRFEMAYPALGERLNALMLLPPPDCARGLLDLVTEAARGKVDPFPEAGVRAVREVIASRRNDRNP